MPQILSPADYAYVQEAVVAAGKKLLQTSNAVLHTKRHALDLVTQADLDSEAFLRERLTKRFPTMGFYSEETAKESEKELENELVWIVDPLDGTLQFSRNLPFFGVSVGLMRQGKPIAGFIYLPKFDDLYHAQKGSGACSGRKKIYVAKREYPAKSVGVLSYTGLSGNQERKLHDIFTQDNVIMLRIGSAIFQLAHTAAGHYDLYVCINNALWDLAAGWAIVEEAGGTVEVWIDEKKKVTGNFYHVSFIASSHETVQRLLLKLKSL
ncbi:MAG: inositol monophosphatase [Candidatus Gottesmanbacteria bacterium]|nr:inositol monophosphatase [Candidatus Gottesmanbacteria bacterium]